MQIEIAEFQDMPLVRFYRNERPTSGGYYLDDILDWTLEEFGASQTHGYWMFPTKTSNCPGMPLISDDEIGVFITDPKLRNKVKESITKELDFFGLRFLPNGRLEFRWPTIQRPYPVQWLKSPYYWPRMTRFLQSLRYLAFTDYSRLICNCMLESDFNIDQDARKLWTGASFDKLP